MDDKRDNHMLSRINTPPLSQKFGIDVLDTNKDGIEIKISVIFNKSRCKLVVAGELFFTFSKIDEEF